MKTTAQQRTLLSEIKEVCCSSGDYLSSSSTPCCVILPDLNEDEVPQVLTCESFWKCLLLHQTWLQNTIHSTITSMIIDNSLSSVDDIVVAYLSSNSIDMLLSVLACTSEATALNNVIPALLNTRWTTQEIISSLQQHEEKGDNSMSGSITILFYEDTMILQEKALHVANGLQNNDRQYTRCLPIPSFSHSFMKHYSQILASSPYIPSRLQPISQQKNNVIQTATSQDAIILFTSGTTGGSKGVRLSHRALLVQALGKLEFPCGYSFQSRMLASTVPLFHVGGLSSFIAILLAKGQLIFPSKCEVEDASISFNVHDILTSLQNKYLPVNTLVVVPAMISSLFFSLLDETNSKQQQQQQQFPQTRLILIGGQSASPNMLYQLLRTFPNAQIVQTYACTEAASSLTFLSLTTNTETNTVAEAKLVGDCVGMSPNHIDLQLFGRLTDDETSKTMSASPIIIKEPYKLGVVATRGPHVMNGYWKRGVKTMTSTYNKSKDWFVGTDLGYWDEQGRLWFGGRIKDIIRTGGETVMAQEVERIILEHPAVIECGVFPRKDERFGEAVACALVTNQPPSLGSIKRWCKQKGLAGYKQPKYLFLMDSLPRNSSSKILKQKLTAEFGSPMQSRI
jgi:acyl-CoA synthetase (AMP-forming)/AMP-acid ligase II